MKNSSSHSDHLFQFIKVMTKAEKRSFKLFVSRSSSNDDIKFIALFDLLDSMDHYDQGKILQKLKISKDQLSNLKTHLYEQLLVSCRLIGVKHTRSIGLREQVDFAKILYDKGLYRQSLKILDRAKKRAIESELFIIAIEIVEMEKNIEIQSNTKDANSRADILSIQSNELTHIVENINALSSITVQLYGLHMKLGFARSERDLNLLESIFLAKIKEANHQETILEKLHLYHAQMWYTYIRYDFVSCYKFACKIISLYKTCSTLLESHYDIHLKALSMKMECLYLLGSYKRLTETLKNYQESLPTIEVNDNGKLAAQYLLYINKVNVIFICGSFTENIGIIKDIEQFLNKNQDRLGHYEITMLHYKIACIYFGVGNYDKCLLYLQKIIAVRDVMIRRDILCFARILNLIASYESARDSNLDLQIKNVYSYLIKMNDMYAVQKEMMAFLKRLHTITASEVRGEIKKLYETLKQYEGDSFEQRPFLYMDILSWLQSKIEGKSFEKIMQEKFNNRIHKKDADTN